MANPRLDWEKLVSDHAKVLGVTATLTGDGVGKYEKVLVTCDHHTHTVMAFRFITKQHCCRSQARAHQPGRENVGRKSAEKNRGRRDTLEVRMKKADATRRRVGVTQPDKPDILYVSTRGGLTKVGRVFEGRAQRWFKDLNLTVVEGWELPQFATAILEQKIHDKFGHLRPLNPDFGKGWTEVFDVDPQEIISFVEDQLRVSHDKIFL